MLAYTHTHTAYKYVQICAFIYCVGMHDQGTLTHMERCERITSMHLLGSSGEHTICKVCRRPCVSSRVYRVWLLVRLGPDVVVVVVVLYALGYSLANRSVLGAAKSVCVCIIFSMRSMAKSSGICCNRWLLRGGGGSFCADIRRLLRCRSDAYAIRENCAYTCAGNRPIVTVTA